MSKDKYNHIHIIDQPKRKPEHSAAKKAAVIVAVFVLAGILVLLLS